MTDRNEGKAEFRVMSNDRRAEVVAQLTDDVLSKLGSAFLQVLQQEGWGKRDLSQISGINETAIGHILAGRRKNLTVETIALLSRAMRKRPELVMHDLRPVGNYPGSIIEKRSNSAASALQEAQVQQPSNLNRGSIANTSIQRHAKSLSEVAS
jgi:hypothetical protein